MKYDIATPYIASYILFREQDRIAMLLRTGDRWKTGYWTVPAGKIEKNESYITGALREAYEEVGVKLSRDQLKCVHVSHRQEDGNTWVDVYFEALSWSGELVNNEPTAHSELQWWPIDELPDTVIETQATALRKIFAGEHYSELGWETT